MGKFPQFLTELLVCNTSLFFNKVNWWVLGPRKRLGTDSTSMFSWKGEECNLMMVNLISSCSAPNLQEGVAGSYHIGHLFFKTLAF